MRSRLAGIAIVVSAALTGWAPVPPDLVERQYSTQIYVGLQQRLTSASNHVPFAMLDLLLAVVLALWIALSWRDLRRGTTLRRVVRPICPRHIILCASAYLFFFAIFGLNYLQGLLFYKQSYDLTAEDEDGT